MKFMHIADLLLDPLPVPDLLAAADPAHCPLLEVDCRPLRHLCGGEAAALLLLHLQPGQELRHHRGHPPLQGTLRADYGGSTDNSQLYFR